MNIFHLLSCPDLSDMNNFSLFTDSADLLRQFALSGSGAICAHKREQQKIKTLATSVVTDNNYYLHRDHLGSTI